MLLLVRRINIFVCLFPLNGHELSHALFPPLSPFLTANHHYHLPYPPSRRVPLVDARCNHEMHSQIMEWHAMAMLLLDDN